MVDNITRVQIAKEKLLHMVEKIKQIRIGVVGDGCLDVYWDADMRLSELSRETPHYPLPVVRERMYPGGGSNVAANAKSIEAAGVYFLSLIGSDWRGDCLMAKLDQWNINTQFMLISDNRITPAYCKPMRSGYSDVVYEDPRIDFENRVPITDEDELSIIENINQMSESVDVIAVCDQLKYGIITQRIRDLLGELATKGKKIVVDSRSSIGLFKNVIIKPNEMEAIMAAYYDNINLDEVNLQTIINGAMKLYERNKAAVVITMGGNGSLWYDGEKIYLAEAIPVNPPIDTVGAGDAFLAAFSCAYGAGFTGPESIAFGNLVSSIVIKKIGMTGTATPEELIQQIENCADILLERTETCLG